MCFRWEKNRGTEKGFGLEDFKMARLSKVSFHKNQKNAFFNISFISLSVFVFPSVDIGSKNLDGRFEQIMVDVVEYDLWSIIFGHASNASGDGQ